MFTLVNSKRGADIDTPWLVLPAGESITVSERVANDAIKRWHFLTMREATEEEVAEIAKEEKAKLKVKAKVIEEEAGEEAEEVEETEEVTEEEVAEEIPEEPREDNPEAIPLEELAVKELRALAEMDNVDHKGLKKAELIEVLK